MDSTVKKRVRIDDNVTEITSSQATRPSKKPKNLVPFDIIDEAFQRIFIISIFILIQSWKVYDLLVLNVSTDENATAVASVVSSLNMVTFLLKYSVIEGGFLWFLPILNISYLSFSPLVTLLLTLVLNLFNILLTSKLNVSVMLALIGPYLKSLQNTKELTIGGDAINPQVIDMDSHFKGKYTIHYVPDSLAKFNVFNFSPGCQNFDERVPFSIPIEFNTTTDIGYIELEYTSPENKRSLLSFRDSEVSKMLSKDYSHLKKQPGYVNDDDRVFYLEVPVKDPGSYKLSKVKDRKGMTMRYVQSTVSFAFCPDVSFALSPKTSPKLCSGSLDIGTMVPLLSYFGVPPLSAKISTSVNGKIDKQLTAEVSLEALSDTYNLTSLYSHKITRNALEQEILKHPEVLAVKQSTTIEFQILEVSDGLGNRKRFNPQSSSTDLRFKLDILTKPSLTLIDMDSSRKLLKEGTKHLSFITSNNIEEQLPFTASFLFKPEDNGNTQNFTHRFKSIEDLRKGVEISAPGTYSLVSVLGRYCDCNVQAAKVAVQQVDPPEVEIVGEPMIDKCVGMTGYNFQFDAKGEPPFVVDYSVFSNSSGIGLRLLRNSVLKGPTHQFEFDYNPPAEGNYVIQFNSVKDANYQKPTALEGQKYSTYFKQRSKVSFFETEPENKRIYTCEGESATVPVYFTGSFPFKFDYSIVDSSGKLVIQKTDQTTNQNKFEISTSDIKTGGTFEIVVANVKDGISCSADIGKMGSVTVITRSDVPEVQFDTKEAVTYHKIVEGDFIDIPLKVKSSVGRNRDSVTYEVSDLNGGVTSKTTIRGNVPLRVSKPGVYKLTGYSNGGCPGIIGKETKTVHVSYYPRPKLTVEAVDPAAAKTPIQTRDIAVAPGCQGSTRRAVLNFTGKAPFIIDYEIRSPGKVESKTMTCDKNSLVIDLPTDKTGVYQHVFKGIYDRLYTKSKIPNKEKLPSISYEIFESPAVVFTGSTTMKLCEASIGNNIPELANVPIKITGKAPFALNLTVNGPDLDKWFVIPDADKGGTLNLNDAVDAKGNNIWKYIKKGEFEIRFNQIVDANGCSQKAFDQFNALLFVITPAPSISKFNSKNHYCIGDHVGYDLTGLPPYSLTYKFNEKHHKAKTGSEFRRLAAKSGNITVVSLEDSSAGRCFISIPEPSKKAKDLQIVIHDIPSVEINQGDSIIQDIHEGDMTEMKFTFTGVPPFSVTYTRTLEPVKGKRGKKAQKVIETKTIGDIWDYEYTVNVGLEGTYEAVEIRDSYCSATRERDER